MAYEVIQVTEIIQFVNDNKDKLRWNIIDGKGRETQEMLKGVSRGIEEKSGEKESECIRTFLRVSKKAHSNWLK